MIGLDFIFLLQHIKDSTTISKSVTATIAPDRAIPRFRKRVSLPSEPIASVSAVVVIAAAECEAEFYFGTSIIIINTNRLFYLDLVGKALQCPLNVHNHD